MWCGDDHKCVQFAINFNDGGCWALLLPTRDHRLPTPDSRLPIPDSRLATINGGGLGSMLIHPHPLAPLFVYVVVELLPGFDSIPLAH